MQRALTSCLALFTLSIFILGTSMAYAEDPELFTPLPADQLKDMSPAQTQRINQIKQRPTTASVTLVRVDVNALREDSIRISLPEAKTLNFSKKNIETRSANDFTWFGALSGAPGTATFVVHDGNITGTIRDDRNLYRVEPVGNGVHALIKVNESRFPPDEPPTFKEIEKRGATRSKPLKTRQGDSPVGIDILVAYTTAAGTAVSDIGATIQLATAEANQSYQNSDVNIRLTMVDSFEVSYSESGKSFQTILADFKGMADVNNRRNNSGADMAVLIINQDDYCGLADAILANASNAFAVVHYDCATGNYSFAHELGHLQGARHDPEHDSSTSPFAYGHGFQQTSVTPRWRTIMAYPCEGGCPRLQYWSNPNVNYNGIAMGTAATHDNARVLNETANIIAGFKMRPTFTAWNSVSEGRSTPGGHVTPVVTGDRITLFLADPNGGIYTTSGNYQVGWEPWKSVSEGRSTPGAPVAAVVTGQDRVTLFLADPNGGIYATSGNYQAGWGPWKSVSEGRSTPGGHVTPVVTGDRIALFLADPNGGIYSTSGNYQAGWGPWRSVSEGSTAPGGHVTAVATGEDRITLFLADPNGGIYTTSGNYQVGWEPWKSVSEGRSTPGAPVAAVVTSQDRVTLFLADPNGGIYTTTKSLQ